MRFGQLCYFWKKQTPELGWLSGHLPWLRTRWPPHSSRNASPIFRTCSWTSKELMKGSSTKHNEADICTLLANTNKSNAFLMISLVTVQRQCCVCSGAWRRWATWVSGLCSPATAAWLPAGRAHHGETTPVAPCTPPASHGPPPSPQLHHLRRGCPATRGVQNCGIRARIKARCEAAIWVCGAVLEAYTPPPLKI